MVLGMQAVMLREQSHQRLCLVQEADL